MSDEAKKAAKEYGLNTGDLSAPERRALYRKKLSDITTIKGNARQQFVNIVAFLASAPDAHIFLFAEIENLENLTAQLRSELESAIAEREFLEKEIGRLRARIENADRLALNSEQPVMRQVSKPKPVAPASIAQKVSKPNADEVKDLSNLLDELDDLDIDEIEPETQAALKQEAAIKKPTVMEEYDRRTKELSQWLRVQLATDKLE